MLISYKEWLELERNQKRLVKLEEAFDLLDRCNDMSVNFDEEEFIDIIMRDIYDEEISEVS